MLRYAPVTKRKTEVKFNSLIEGGNSETNYGKLMNFLKKRNVRNYNDLLKELKNTTKNIGNVKNYELNHYINTKNSRVLELLWSLGKLKKERLEKIMIDTNSSFLYNFMKNRFNINLKNIVLKSIKKGSKNVFRNSYNDLFLGNIKNRVKLKGTMSEKNINKEYRSKKNKKNMYLKKAINLFNKYQETKNNSILRDCLRPVPWESKVPHPPSWRSRTGRDAAQQRGHRESKLLNNNLLANETLNNNY